MVQRIRGEHRALFFKTLCALRASSVSSVNCCCFCLLKADLLRRQLHLGDEAIGPWGFRLAADEGERLLFGDGHTRRLDHRRWGLAPIFVGQQAHQGRGCQRGQAEQQ
jgi:hypothetical protein